MTAERQIEAVIFDFDGVLVDSEPVHIEAWEIYLRTHGHEFDHQLLERMLGRRIIDSASMLVSELGLPVSAQTAADERNATFTQIAPGRIHPKPFAIEVLTELERCGVKIGLATSGILDYVEMAIESAELPHVFDARVTAEDVKHGKPDPEVFLTAAERLQIPPSACLVVEDAPNGVEAAHRAGMSCAAIPETDMTRRLMPETEFLLDNLGQLLPALSKRGYSLSSSSQG